MDNQMTDIREAAKGHFKLAGEAFYVDMEWLIEIEEEARRVLSTSRRSDISLLPKTPSMKRKHEHITKLKAPKYQSTFHEGSENKKLKIDEFSTIIDKSATTTILPNNTDNTSRNMRSRSTVQPGDTSINTSSRTLRPRNNKNVQQQPVKRSQRIKKKNADVEEHIEEQSSPLNVKNNQPLQPKVAALIQSLGFTTPKRHQTQNGVLFTNVEGKINFSLALDTPEKLFTDVPDGNMKVEETPNPPSTEISTERVDSSKHPKVDDKILCIDSMEVVPAHIDDSTTEKRIAAKVPLHHFASTPSDDVEVTNLESTDKSAKNAMIENIHNNVVTSTPTDEVEVTNVVTSTPIEEVEVTDWKSTEASSETFGLKFCAVVGKENTNTQLSGNAPNRDLPSPTQVEVVPPSREQVIPPSPEEGIHKSPELDPVAPSSEKEVSSVQKIFPPLVREDSQSPEREDSQSPEREDSEREDSPSSEKNTSRSPGKENLSSDDEVIIKTSRKKKSTEIAVDGGVQKAAKVPTDNDGGRRDTYKIIVGKIIDGNDEENSQQKPKKLIKKVLTLKKTNSGGNIVTDKKTFIRKESPQEPGSGAKKVIEKFEKNESNRLKGINKAMAPRKQPTIEEKKRNRADRERRYKEQQLKIQEEEENKRKLLLLKEEIIARNQEALARQKEDDIAKLRKEQAMKKAIMDDRRQKAEDEQQRKLLDQLRDEQRKQDILQTKALQEEQARLKRIADKDKADKDRLRVIEEERLLEEERKKRDFEEKEKHRLEVERKKNKLKEEERYENQQREDKLRQAEKEINDAKKREERQKEKDRLKNTGVKTPPRLPHKHNDFKIPNKDVLPMPARASPRLAQKENNFKMPKKDVACTNSPAAYLPKRVMQPHNPPASYNPPAAKLPEKVVKPYNPPVIPLVARDCSYTSYGIDDLVSDDSTDDESEPAKPVPSWACGAVLKKQLLRQYLCNVNPDDIFINCMQPLRLERIFNKTKSRYFKRTSSAHWSSPPMKNPNIYNKLLQK